MHKNLSQLPLFLTIARLIISPVIMPCLLLYGVSPVWAFAFFVFFAGTDFLDGYLARRYGWETVLGKLLDPAADKILILSTAVTLVGLGQVSVGWAVTVVSREIFVMGLREVALMNGVSINVSGGGKLKTAAQCMYLALVILAVLPGVRAFFAWCSLFLTLYSGIAYFWGFCRQHSLG